MRRALPPYEQMFAQKNIDFFAELAQEATMQLHADSVLQMLSVLLDNAVKYTPPGGSVRLTLCKNGEHIELTEENSCTVPPDADAERLFERFYRGDSARTQDGSATGYGIGLSAARAIAENFGGTLKASYGANGTIRFVARF